MLHGRLPREEIINKIKQVLKNEPKGLTQRGLSRKTGIPVSTLHRYITKYLNDCLITKKIGKTKLVKLKNSKSESAIELLLENVKKASNYGLRLREEGYSYAEIAREIQRRYGMPLKEVTAYKKFHKVQFSDKGLQRYKQKISKDRSRAGKIGGAKLAKSGFLDKIRPLAVEKAREVNLKSIPSSAKKLTLEKIHIIAHCLFDGFVSTGLFGYSNASEALIKLFKSDVKQVYGFRPSDERINGKTICVRYVSKLATADLLTYTPSYSTNKGTLAKIPDLILKGSKKEWQEFLKCFWDDEGASIFNVRIGGKRSITRQLEAFCANSTVRKQLTELHKNLGIDCYEKGNKIIISGKKNLTKFSKLINFSKGVKVGKGFFWKGLEKSLVLEHILESYHRRRLIYVKNYGCTANRHDLEVMLAYLIKGGYEIIDVPELADVLLVNTCGVKTPTEDRVIFHLRSLSRLKKPIIIAGCLPKIDLPAIKKAVPNYSAIMDPYSVSKILLAVKKAEQNEKNNVFFSQKPEIKLRLPKVRTNRLIEIIQIAEGCTGSCSFCCVKFARGRLFSYPKELIVSKAKKAVKNGVREIWITAQDTGAYGRDIGVNLIELLEEICRIEGKFFVRVGMMTPNHALEILDGLVNAYKNGKIFKFLHLPVQSGDDKVLKRMRRLYSVNDFKDIIGAFRASFPKATIATDVICGFPSETKEAFERTLRLIEDVQPDIVNVSKFFARPRTSAADMHEYFVNSQEIKRRSGIAAKLARKVAFERNQRWVGWTGEVLVDEVGKVPGSWVGRNFAYKPIVLKNSGSGDLIGKTFDVKVVEAFRTYLKGEIVE